jgi:hypothetical protein
MVEVRIATVDPESYSGQGDRFRNSIGQITGVSGQFVKVHLTHDPHGNEMNEKYDRLFLPNELSMR